MERTGTSTAARQPLTRREARMIAEEVVKLLEAKGTRNPPEEYIDAKQAAEFLGCSVSYIYHNMDKIPYTSVGGGRRKMFLKSKLAQYANRTEWM
uniref:hypothetical protein n=1 Tax=Prevotella sp. TaxID=59823 RepID=UPI003FF0C21D